jgi:hypothetical protein
MGEPPDSIEQYETIFAHYRSYFNAGRVGT